MATKAVEKTDGYTFRWQIENISHCWFEKGRAILSPTFIAEGMKWSLQLYPKGYNNENSVHIFLARRKDCSGPNDVYINFQTSLLHKDGSSVNITPTTVWTICFVRGNGHPAGSKAREELFVTEREAFIPEDTLTVQCTISQKSRTPVKPRHLSARTVFKVNRRSFSWKIDEFSTLKPGLRTKFKDDLIDFDLAINEGLDLEKKLVIDGVLLDQSVKYFSFKTHVIDSEGKMTDCGTHEYFASDLKRGISTTVLFVDKLLKDKSRNFPNDVLSLECEYVCSNGTVSYEFCGYGIISPEVTNVTIEKGNEHRVGKEETDHSPALVIDMKSMFNDGLFSDMELRTSSQNFPVHKNILSARSPVFKRMFSNDMKEMNTGHVDITDLEDDTVRRLIHYVYTDSVEDIELENAIKLYLAADKYEILPLRSRCSSFLKNNLCVNKACDILAVADLYQDEDRKPLSKIIC